jgi:DNA-binding transcriptional LysR family regulator
MDLNEILVFARVVQAGSFTKAATVLGMPKSTVSRKVSDLEDRLDTRLLQRTTRKLSLTDAGRTYFDYCSRIVAEVEDAERAVGSLHATPRGLLRVTTGVNTAYMGPILVSFMKRYPEVRLELLCTGRPVDLVEERFDIAIRAGVLADSTLIARKLGAITWHLVATPGYLKKRGRPRSPGELAAHDCLLFGAGTTTMQLHLERDGETTSTAIHAHMLVGDMDILATVVTAGLGIALLPAYRCTEELRARRLVRVLPEWSAPATPIHILYPSTRHLSPKVTSFVEHLQQHTTSIPWQ